MVVVLFVLCVFRKLRSFGQHFLRVFWFQIMGKLNIYNLKSIHFKMKSFKSIGETCQNKRTQDCLLCKPRIIGLKLSYFIFSSFFWPYEDLIVWLK